MASHKLPKAGGSPEDGNVIYNTRQTAPPLKNSPSPTKDKKQESHKKDEAATSTGFTNRFKLGENPEWLHADYSPFKRDALRSLKYQRDRDMKHQRLVGGYDPLSTVREPDSGRPDSRSSTGSRSVFARSVPYETIRQRLTGFHYEFNKQVTPKVGSLEKHFRIRRSTIVKVGHDATVNTYEVW